MKYLKLLMAMTIILGIVTFQACKDDEGMVPLCDRIECYNGATCKDGRCRCELGYEGNTCEELTRDKYLGDYYLAASCDDGEGYSTDASVRGFGADDLGIVVDFDSIMYVLIMGENNVLRVIGQEGCPTCIEVEGGSGSLNFDGSISFKTVLGTVTRCNYNLQPK